MIQQWKTTADKPIEQFPISQQVTFRYYEGREAILTLNYEEALEKMRFVFENCTPKHKGNKRLSLMCLIPLWLLKGRGPTEKLLLKYDLQDMFGELVRAYFQGNVRVFQEILEEKRIIFVKQGTYLILEQLKSLTFRNLFRRVYTIVKPPKQELFLKDIQTGLRLLQVEMETDEIECIMANLIYKKYARAYISRDKGCVKFDPRDPFPKLSGVTLQK